jgi:hypothetical protein
MATKRKIPGTAPSPKRRKPSEDEERAEYVITMNRRWVKPYYFHFSTGAKQRWWNQSIIDVFTREFVAYPKEYYVSNTN